MYLIGRISFFAILVIVVKSERISNEITSNLVKGSDVRQGREYFHHFAPAEEEKKPEYPTLTYPPSYYPIRDGPTECPPSPLMPLLGNGLNFLLLKLGAIGIIKTVVALIFLGFLIKLPILFVKLAFLKSFFLPVLIAPLLLNLFSQHMMQPSKPTQDEKPGETTEPTEGMGRQFEEFFANSAWDSVRMLAQSDKCFERISCVIGAYNNDTAMGTTFSKMLKFLQVSSPSSIQDRVSSIREAYKNGKKDGFCSPEEYRCESPQLLLQHGANKIRVA